MNIYLKQFGAEYNCAAYGAGSFNSDQSCAALTNANGGLADTGTNVAIGITGGALLIVASIAMIVMMKRKARKATK